ncbi:MAG: PLDc N-terminal domain-containing protein [Proteobacteria bacterium]|nr:PLDc N-terminal domain-containing protein [Pseudomonadota bacterium]MBU1387252.1 PLDc N-terminal domain-containing protein [Pseudomonadota bacterium]MBU1544912.1 PLDc N-terminal domain-containing protein [Pseudomonadota bacterium]MBU2430659.1 PLDc N-terminal domain-containing protein [Pseudomonadota bacterium]MBU2482527.1 PLDc N-terminal domain-containing protein [Pseudomonadota bacterium]
MDQTLLYLLIIVGISFGLTMLTLIDIILKDFGSTKTKILWHFIALIPIAGCLTYLIFGFRKGKRIKP